MNRRHFVGITAVGAGNALAAESIALGNPKLAGKVRRDEPGSAHDSGGGWYTGEAAGDGLSYEFPAGTLAGARSLSCDMMVEAQELSAFAIVLREGPGGRAFRFSFGALAYCGFRVRFDLALVDQRLWMTEREGAFLKPRCGGDRVDLEKVDRLSFTLARKSPHPVRWTMSELRALPGAPPAREAPNLLLPKGPLLDELGQNNLKDWPGKTRGVEQMTARIRGQHELAKQQCWPESFSRWGGSKRRKLGPGTGWFRTHHDGRRWWLADPDGFAFWSAGMDCVRLDSEARIDGMEPALKWIPSGPEFAEALHGREGLRPGARSVNFMAANMIRAFGREGWRDKWAEVALAELKRMRFNTVGNWSEWRFAARAGFPYVRPMSFRGRRSGTIYRDFPDVFHPGFAEDAAEYASELESTAKDPALIGYFLMNEPTWAFSTELPAAGMLYNAEDCSSRRELARFLRRKYEGDDALARAWKTDATFDRLARGKWRGILPPQAGDDLRDFSLAMVERYFQTISAACRKADPHHLNLGMRWAGIPKDWAVPGMKAFDVFSLNCYQEKLPRESAARIESMLKMPVMVGEWHFGALDAGLPASGLGHVRTQQERGRAYRAYLEDAAAGPHCVGVHWFTMYDQSAIGRFDGENYNIGFLDVCHRPYEELAGAAIASHERMYEVASGAVPPFADAPEYLPRVAL